MGFLGNFGKNIGQRWNDGSLMAGLQSAGAIAQGDFGTAAQIQGLQRRKKDEEEQQAAQQAQMQATVAALVRQGIPLEDAQVIASGGGGDSVLAGRYNQPQGEEFTYFDDNAGNRWRQNKRTGEVDQQPTFVDRNPRQFMQDGQFITVPNSYAGQQPQQQQSAAGPPPGAVVDGWVFKGGDPNDRGNWEKLGGGAGNGAGNFRPF